MLLRLLHFFEKYPIDFLSYVISCLPIGIGLVRFRYLKAGLRYIWLFFVVFFLKDTYSLVQIFINQNNLFIQNIEPIFETVFVGLIFLPYFDKPIEKRVLLGLTALCTAITIYAYQRVDVSAVSLSTFRIFALVLVLAYFNKLLTDMRVINLTQHTMFWFASSLLLYAAGTFFIVLYSEYWYKDINKVPADVFDKYWNANQFLYITFATLSAVGLWFARSDRQNVT